MKKALNMIIFSLMLSSPVGAAGTLIAVASNGNQESSLVSRDPVDSDYYLLFADTGELLEVLDNPYRGGPKGAGKGVAEFLAQHNIDVVVAEYFSPALTREIESRGLRPVVFRGLAREAVRRFALTGNKKVTPSNGDNR